MTQSYKTCPSCDSPVALEAPQCPRCGHQFLAAAPSPGMMPPPSSFGPQGPSRFPPTQPGMQPMQPGMQPGMQPMPYGQQQYMLSPQEINSKRITAGILGILLGGLGLHKFVMGKTQAGVIMLLVSILSCGMAAPIIGLIGFVEGIMYLSKSDADFYQTYLAGNKEWF